MGADAQPIDTTTAASQILRITALDTERPLAFRTNLSSPPFGEASPEVRSLRLEVRT
jgi:hypothetical protein